MKQTRRSLFGSLMAAFTLPFVGRSVQADTIRDVKIRVDIEKLAAPLKPMEITVVESVGCDHAVIGSLHAKRQFFELFMDNCHPGWRVIGHDNERRFKEHITDSKPMIFYTVGDDIAIAAFNKAIKNCGMSVHILRMYESGVHSVLRKPGGLT